MTEEDNRAIAQRLIDQHPAALRSVCWSTGMHQHRLHHLEIETKHGRVLLFDHRQPRVYCNPPHPPGNAPQNRVAQRSWRDLTEQVPVAFDARPLITSVSFDHDTGRWNFLLSTGAKLIFVLDTANPLLLSS